MSEAFFDQCTLSAAGGAEDLRQLGLPLGMRVADPKRDLDQRPEEVAPNAAVSASPTSRLMIQRRSDSCTACAMTTDLRNRSPRADSQRLSNQSHAGIPNPRKGPSALGARRSSWCCIAAVTVVRSSPAAPGNGRLRRYKSTQAHASLYAPSVSQSPAGSEDSRCSYQDPTT